MSGRGNGAKIAHVRRLNRTLRRHAKMADETKKLCYKCTVSDSVRGKILTKSQENGGLWCISTRDLLTILGVYAPNSGGMSEIASKSGIMTVINDDFHLVVRVIPDDEPGRDVIYLNRLYIKEEF